MTDLLLRPASECAFDQISLGEVMLRLDPGEGRIRTARDFPRLGRRRRIQHARAACANASASRPPS